MPAFCGRSRSASAVDFVAAVVDRCSCREFTPTFVSSAVSQQTTYASQAIGSPSPLGATVHGPHA